MFFNMNAKKSLRIHQIRCFSNIHNALSFGYFRKLNYKKELNLKQKFKMLIFFTLICYVHIVDITLAYVS